MVSQNDGKLNYWLFFVYTMSKYLLEFSPELKMNVCVCVCVCSGGGVLIEKVREYGILFTALSVFGFLEDRPFFTTDAEFFKPNSAESSDTHLS